MKHIINNMKIKAAAAAVIGMTYAGHAMAQSTLPTVDLTKDQSNGKKVSDVANNLNAAAQSGASLLVQLVAIGGFCVVALSLLAMYKASKDEREKPMSAVAGLFIGGAMAAVGSIMWIMKNTITG